MGRFVTEKEKEKMWKLYQELGTFTKVAKRMRRHRDTVSRYVHEYEAAIRVMGYMENRK